MKTTAYKVLSHSMCPPVRGGNPVCSIDDLPFTLPPVDVDDSNKECASGWNACSEGHIALRVAGLWPDGWPARIFQVQTHQPVIERGNKLRSSTWTIIEEVDIAPHIERLSQAFGEYAEVMTAEQLAWHRALCRPHYDPTIVERSLRAALAARGLSWRLRHLDNDRSAWNTRAAWAARATWNARAAWDTWNTRDAWAAWAAWDARAARAALTWHYASLMGWVNGSPNRYDIGIRNAYEHGLDVVVQTDHNELGWAMVEEQSE